MFNAVCGYGSRGFLGDFGAWGWIGPILGFVVWIGLLVGLAVLVIWAIRRTRASGPRLSYAGGQSTAEGILQARYARGEITREQYQQMKQDIGQGIALENLKGESTA